MSPEDRLKDLRDPDRWESVRVPRPASRSGGRSVLAPARVGQLVAAFAIAVLVVGGIVAGLFALRDAPPPASTVGPSPTATASITAPGVVTVVPGDTHVYTATMLPPACSAAQVRTSSKQDGGAAAGSYIQAVAIANTGSDCLLPAGAVRVGGTTVQSAVPGAPEGLVLPARATARLTVETAEACQPNGTKANIDDTKPVLPIVLDLGGTSRTLTARFPKSVCTQPSAEAFLDDAVVAPSSPSLTSTIDQPSKTPAGQLRYDATIQLSGSSAARLEACPSVTEVLTDGSGTTVTRALALRCAAGTSLQPDIPVVVPVVTTIPTRGVWTISWFIGPVESTIVASSTCTLAQLTVTEPGPGGAAAGSWVQLITVRNLGSGCILPVTAFSLSGQRARAGASQSAAGIDLAAGSTTRIAFTAATECPDGASNFTNPSTSNADGKPVVLELGGHDASGLDQPFPRLHCAGPYIDLVN